MKKRTINGKVYTLIPEERERTCFGCAFFGVFNETHTCPYIQPECKNGMIFKVLETEKAKKTNLKPFNLEEAKAGKPVCTRDGRKARIICFDTKGSTRPIIALIEKDEKEVPSLYMLNGKKYEDEEEWKGDLMMLSEKKERWINVYHLDNGYNVGSLYPSEEEAKKQKDTDCVATVKIEWEE